MCFTGDTPKQDLSAARGKNTGFDDRKNDKNKNMYARTTTTWNSWMSQEDSKWLNGLQTTYKWDVLGL